jgi:hypothetical protein
VGCIETDYFALSLMAAEIFYSKYIDVNFICSPYLYYIISFILSVVPKTCSMHGGGEKYIQNLSLKAEGKRQLGTLRHRWEEY